MNCCRSSSIVNSYIISLVFAVLKCFSQKQRKQQNCINSMIMSILQQQFSKRGRTRSKLMQDKRLLLLTHISTAKLIFTSKQVKILQGVMIYMNNRGQSFLHGSQLHQLQLLIFHKLHRFFGNSTCSCPLHGNFPFLCLFFSTLLFFLPSFLSLI